MTLNQAGQFMQVVGTAYLLWIGISNTSSGTTQRATWAFLAAAALVTSLVLGWVADNRRGKERKTLLARIEKLESKTVSLSPRELEIKADFEQLNCAEQAVTRFVLKRGTVHIAQVWNFMDQQSLKGKLVESVRARTGFILGVEELTINPEFKPLSGKDHRLKVRGPQGKGPAGGPGLGKAA